MSNNQQSAEITISEYTIPKKQSPPSNATIISDFNAHLARILHQKDQEIEELKQRLEMLTETPKAKIERKLVLAYNAIKSKNDRELEAIALSNNKTQEELEDQLYSTSETVKYVAEHIRDSDYFSSIECPNDHKKFKKSLGMLGSDLRKMRTLAFSSRLYYTKRQIKASKELKKVKKIVEKLEDENKDLSNKIDTITAQEETSPKSI